MVHQHIIPAIIPESLPHLEGRLRTLGDAVRRVQVDVMDGIYTAVGSWPYVGVEDTRNEKARREYELPYWHEYDFEIDLMVEEPEKYLEEWSLAGASCVIVHIETVHDMEFIIAQCEKRRLELAIALKPATELEHIAPYVDEVLFIQCMGNNHIGTHGMPLQVAVLEKIRTIKARWPHGTIGVDIGVQEETVQFLCDAGASRFAVGSAIFGTDDPVGAYARLEAMAIKNLQEHSR